MKRAVLLLALAGCFETYESQREPIEWEAPARSAAEVIADFQYCMDFDDWSASGMNYWSQVFTSQGPCFQCHADAGMFSFDDFTFLTPMRVRTENLLYLFAFDPAGDGTMTPNERHLQLAADGVDPVDHPRFANDQFGLQTLRDYTRLTYERIAAQLCVGAPPLPSPR